MFIGGRLSVLIVMCVLFSLSFAYHINSIITCAPSTVKVSPSGRYIIENVSVGTILFSGRMAYLRIIDSRAAKQVYRSPLYDAHSLDMHAFEDNAQVGITWLEFDKENKRFTVSMPEWKGSWLNIFVSNTPYDIIPN
jgi:hypothetical protein